MFNYFVFNGKSSMEFGVYISGDGTFSAPERDQEAIQVPGRTGDLLYDNKRYRNTTFSYKCGIVRNFEENFAAFRSFMLSQKGYQRLEDSYHRDEFVLAYVSDELNPEMIADLKAGQFVLTFTRKPQRFLKSGERAVTVSSGTFLNPTSFDASPLILCEGAGTLTINDTVITITGDQEYTYLDCDLQDAYYGSTNLNPYVTVSGYEFPKLEPGSNTISISGLTSVKITPRWWSV